MIDALVNDHRNEFDSRDAVMTKAEVRALATCPRYPWNEIFCWRPGHSRFTEMPAARPR